MQVRKSTIDMMVSYFQMGKTVEFEDNLKVLKELESLSKCSLYYPMRGRKNGSSKHPLEQLGLFLKDD